jgi:hypothetical protein
VTPVVLAAATLANTRAMARATSRTSALLERIAATAASIRAPAAQLVRELLADKAAALAILAPAAWVVRAAAVRFQTRW